MTTIFALGSLSGPKHKTLTFLHFSFELANRRDELSNYTPFSCPLRNLASAEEVSIFDAVKADSEGVQGIRSLVQKDPSLLESIGNGGQTPLVSTVLQGKFHSVKTLLELGADVYATEKDGYNSARQIIPRIL